MTAALLFLYMVGAILATFAMPIVAAATYAWLACTGLQSGITGILALPWSTVMIVAFLLSYTFHAKRQFSLRSGIFFFLLAFYCWTLITTSTALLPEIAQSDLWDFTRAIIAVFLIGGAISDRRDLNFVVWAMVCGGGSIAVGGLAQVVLSGGHGMVSGVQATGFAGNNEVARLFGVVTMPFALFFSYHAAARWLRGCCKLLFATSVLAILGTFSRGAFVALAAFFVHWTIISRHRTRFILQGFVLVVLVAIAFSSTGLMSRMATIGGYQSDRSFQGREFAWDFAMKTASEHPFVGGGFGAFHLALDPAMAKLEVKWRDAHSIYFEALGHHGYVGLVLYLLLLLGTIAKARSIAKRCSGNPQFYWERDLAIAAQFALIFHMVGGLTISTTYDQYVLFVIMIVAILDKITRGIMPQALPVARDTKQYGLAIESAPKWLRHSSQ